MLLHVTINLCNKFEDCIFNHLEMSLFSKDLFSKDFLFTCHRNCVGDLLSFSKYSYFVEIANVSTTRVFGTTIGVDPTGISSRSHGIEISVQSWLRDDTFKVSSQHKN